MSSPKLATFEKAFKLPTLSTFLASENRENDNQVLEEAEDDGRRLETGDVGPRRGRDAQGGQEEKGKRIRRFVSERFAKFILTHIRAQISGRVKSDKNNLVKYLSEVRIPVVLGFFQNISGCGCR